jgi:hypothetical protein
VKLLEAVRPRITKCLTRRFESCHTDDAVRCEPVSATKFPAIPRLNEDPRSCVDTGGQVDSGVVDDSPWIFVRSGTRRTVVRVASDPDCYLRLMF